MPCGSGGIPCGSGGMPSGSGGGKSGKPVPPPGAPAMDASELPNILSSASDSPVSASSSMSFAGAAVIPATRTQRPAEVRGGVRGERGRAAGDETSRLRRPGLLEVARAVTCVRAVRQGSS